MILIADSGSTKTDWVFLDLETGQKTYFEGFGLNPYLINSDDVCEEVLRLFKKQDIKSIREIRFYGAGCSTESNKQIITEGLVGIFKNANIQVFHDLEGAARALCKHEEGIACILGTGSNACLFNGKEIERSAISLGYLIGDEGSGNYLGKKLIHSVYLGLAPEEIIRNFEDTFNLSTTELLSELYKKPFPNRFLASFAPFIGANRNNGFIKELIYSAFDDFIHAVVKPLKPDRKLPLHFTGSIAWFFKEELTHITQKNGYQLGIIEQKTIEELANYHFYLHKKQ